MNAVVRRFTKRPWTWLVVATLAEAVVIFGLRWPDTLDIRTDARVLWSDRIIIAGGLGLFAVEAARRLWWWFGTVALAALTGFVVVGLMGVIEIRRMEDFREEDRRAITAHAPLEADVTAPSPAAGVAAREEWTDLELTLEPVLTGLTQPVAVEAIPGTDRYIVLQREGEIRTIPEGGTGGTILLDLGDETTLIGEQGMFDIAIGPVDGRLYVSMSDLAGDNLVVSYAIGADDSLSDRQLVIPVTQPYERHNGGALEFDADGYLLLGVGDGGQLGDPLGSGQDRSNRLASVLRIAPLANGGYEIPPDNPYIDVPGVWPEIYAYGLRNPWRMSTDPSTGDIWIGDVGQDRYEEINRIPYGKAGGSNFGWNRTEGPDVYIGRPENPKGFTDADIPADKVDPVHFYLHDLEATEGARNSIVGGYIYRGSAIPHLEGTYVYADFSASIIGAVLIDSGAAVESGELFGNVPAVVSLGVDDEGELLIVPLAGEISRLTPSGRVSR